MIKQIRIKNYQSLKDVTLEPGKFTVIVGSSDVGKSAVIRAIKSVLINRTGQDFISHGAKQAAVALTFEDNSTVAWIKSDSATYKVKDVSGNVVEFVKTGRTVPDEVQETLRMGEISIGTDKIDINIHGQFDAPFLITETPALKARLLGELSGINILYLSIQEARRVEQQSKRALVQKSADIESVKARIRDYADLPVHKKALDSIGWNIDLVIAMDSDIAMMSSAIDTIDHKIKVGGHWAVVKQAFSKSEMQYDEIMKQVGQLNEINEEVAILCQKVASINSIRNTMLEYDETINKLQSELAKIDICPVCGSELEEGHFNS